MSVSDKNTRIIITIPKETKKLLSEAAKKERRSVSNLCSKIIYDYVTKQEGE